MISRTRVNVLLYFHTARHQLFAVKGIQRAVERADQCCYDETMKRSLHPSELRRLEEELRKLKHLQKTRMLSLDDGQFVREVVTEMHRRISEVEALLYDSDRSDSEE